MSCRQREDTPEPLAYPAAVSFVTIHEKHVDAQPSVGRFTAISRIGAVLDTEAPLERFENLQIAASGKLFATIPCVFMQVFPCVAWFRPSPRLGASIVDGFNVPLGDSAGGGVDGKLILHTAVDNLALVLRAAVVIVLSVLSLSCILR